MSTAFSVKKKISKIGFYIQLCRILRQGCSVCSHLQEIICLDKVYLHVFYLHANVQYVCVVICL